MTLLRLTKPNCYTDYMSEHCPQPPGCFELIEVKMPQGITELFNNNPCSTAWPAYGTYRIQ